MFLILAFVMLLISVSPAEGIATAIAGVVAPIVAELFKRFSGASGNVALIISVAVSAVIALVAMYFAGELHTFGDVVKQVGAVFTIATLVYKLIMAPVLPPAEKKS